MEKIKGLSVALLTHFQENGAIDWQVLEDHINFLMNCGVENLFILGTTGEMFLLEYAERKEITERIINFVNGEINVFVHVGALPREKACDLAEHAEKNNATGIGAVSPYYYSFQQVEIKNYYKDIASSVSDEFPLYLYNLPQNTSNDIIPSTVEDLAEVDNIIGIKNSMNDLERIWQLMMINSKSNFDIINGEDKIILPSLQAGAAGFVSGTANIFPELFLDLYLSFEKENYAKSRKIQTQLIRFFTNIKNLPSLAVFKAVLFLRGFKKIYMRRPLRELKNKEIRFLKNLIIEIFPGKFELRDLK